MSYQQCVSHCKSEWADANTAAWATHDAAVAQCPLGESGLSCRQAANDALQQGLKDALDSLLSCLDGCARA